MLHRRIQFDLPASTSCMIARAVKDLVSEPMTKGVCGVGASPPGRASPKPRKWTISSPSTMTNAAPVTFRRPISRSRKASISPEWLAVNRPGRSSPAKERRQSQRSANSQRRNEEFSEVHRFVSLNARAMLWLGACHLAMTTAAMTPHTTARARM